MKNLVVLLLLTVVLFACVDENHRYLETTPKPTLEISSDTVREEISDPSSRGTSYRTYWLTSKSPVSEGSAFTVTMNTTNVSSGTVIPYSITGILGSDLSAGGLTGNFTIGSDGKSALSFSAKADKSTEGTETMKIAAKTTSLSIQISDASTGSTVTTPVPDIITGVTGALFGFASLTKSAPLSYSNKSNFVIENLSISGAGADDLILSNCSNVTITNCYFGYSVQAGIRTNNCSNITIKNCFFANNKPGVIAYKTTQINITGNQFLNAHRGAGEVYGGNFIKFDQVTGANNSITNNRLEAIAGESDTEDLISMNNSNGVSGSPILIQGNIIKGGGPSTTGGAIQTGDGTGSWQTTRGNTIYNPSGFGVAVSGGTNMVVDQNTVVMRSNIGSTEYLVAYYVANYAGGTCSNVSISKNVVAKGSTGYAFSNNTNSGYSCSSVTQSDNIWDKALSLFPVPSMVVNVSAVDYLRIRAEYSLVKNK